MPTFIDTELDLRHASGVVVGDYLFATGTAMNPVRGKRFDSVASIADEVAQCFVAIDAVLEQAGLTRADLVKTTCWITDEAYREEFIAAYRDECVEGVYPARVTMVAGLRSDCRVAIEAVAIRGR